MHVPRQDAQSDETAVVPASGHLGVESAAPDIGDEPRWLRWWCAAAYWVGAPDCLIAVGLMVAATLFRLPYLWEVPRFTDELPEILWALAIYRGDIRPLTAVDSYYGPLWSYLLAGAFAVGSPVIPLEQIPRLLVMLVAVVTVGVTYVVVRDLAGRFAGIVAAALMTTSGAHIIINSHTARSNSVTPLLTTLLVWLLCRAALGGSGWLLVLAGVGFGLALQTHLSVITFTPGLALGLMAMRPRLLMSRWVPLALVGFCLGYWNMILFNFQSDFWSVTHALALQQGYNDGRAVDLSRYATNLSTLVESLGRITSGTIDAAGSLAGPLYLALALGGLLFLARRGNVLPLAFCVSAMLVMPYFNPRYGPILSGRYIVPLLPFLYLGIAVVLPTLMLLLPSAAQRLPNAATLLPSLWPTRHALARTTLASALILFPIVPLTRYYRAVLDDGRTNRRLLTLSGAVVNAFRYGQIVLVDEGLAQEQLTAGGTDLKALRMLLEAGGIPYEVVKLNWQGLRPALDRYETVLVVMASKKADQLDRRVEVLPLTAEIGSASGSGREYGVYMLERPDAHRGAPLAGGAAVGPLDGR